MSSKITSSSSLIALLEDILNHYDKYGFPSPPSVCDFNRQLYKKHGYGIPLNVQMISARRMLVEALKNKKVPHWMKISALMSPLIETFHRVANKFEMSQQKGKRKSPSDEDSPAIIGYFDVEPLRGEDQPKKRLEKERVPKLVLNVDPKQNRDSAFESGNRTVVAPPSKLLQASTGEQSNQEERRIIVGNVPNRLAKVPEKRAELVKPRAPILDQQQGNGRIESAQKPAPIKSSEEIRSLLLVQASDQTQKHIPTERQSSLQGARVERLLVPMKHLPEKALASTHSQTNTLSGVLTQNNEPSVLELEKKIRLQQNQIQGQTMKLYAEKKRLQEREKTIGQLRTEVEQWKAQISQKDAEMDRWKNSFLEIDRSHRESVELVSQLHNKLSLKDVIIEDKIRHYKTEKLRSKELEKNLEQLKGELVESKSEIQKKTEEHEKDQSRIEELMKQAKEFGVQLKKRKLDETIQLEEKIRKLVADKKETTSLVQKKIQKSQSEKSRANELRSKLKEAEGRVKELEEKVAYFTAKNNQLNDTVLAMNNHEIHKKEKIKSLEKELAAKNKIVEELTSSSEESKARIYVLEETARRKETEEKFLIKNLSEAVDCLAKANQISQELRAELEKGAETERNLRAELGTRREQSKTTVEEKEVQTEQGNDQNVLSKELDEREHEITSLKEELEKSRSEANESITDLKSKVTSLQLVIKNKTIAPEMQLMTKISELEKELLEMEESLQTSQETIEIYKQTARNQEDVINRLQMNGHHPSLPNTPVVCPRNSSRRQTIIPIKMEIE